MSEHTSDGASAAGGGTRGGLLGRVARRLRPSPRTRVARVFDGQRDGTPWFAPEHPVIVDPGEREDVLGLLRSGAVILHAAQRLRDHVGGQEAAVPASLRSDGVWIWSDACAYFLDRYWIAPDAELVRHLRTAGPALPVDAKTWRRLSAAIRPDAWKGMTWPLD
ncbi:hypothetical protein ACFWZW_02895 [Microbacterium enclense]|uniref:hypothetical protein n=1 Tax=Microbacterium enclense TaxID=993073 RepID=UPI0036DCAC92